MKRRMLSCILLKEVQAFQIADQQTLNHEIQAWQNRRNEQQTKTSWRFTTDDRRIKLKRLYPSTTT